MVNSSLKYHGDFRSSDAFAKTHRTQNSRIAHGVSPSLPEDEHRPPPGEISFVDFVERHFLPEHVASKSLSGRTHYSAILKHVIRPEEVTRVFGLNTSPFKSKLKTVSNWPYIGELSMSDIRPAHVQQLVSAALEKGYSTQTALHIRNVVGAVFEHAKKVALISANPAAEVAVAEMVRKDVYVPNLSEIKSVLNAMRYPEKEMTLFALLTDMNMGEICGLQWKHVNLLDVWSNTSAEPIPPRHLAVRAQWRRGELSETAQNKRHRHVPIPVPLLPLLALLRARGSFTGPDDFALITRAGTPISEGNILQRRVKAIGKELNMPWLSWQVFRHAHTTLTYEIGNTHLAQDVSRAAQLSD